MGRVAYLEDSNASAEAIDALAAVRERRGFVSNVHRALAHSPSALNAFERFSMHVNGESRLDVRTRELVILRTAQLLGNEYEWRRHVPKALQAGVPLESLKGLAEMNPPGLAKKELAALALVKEHVAGPGTTPVTVEAVRTAYGEEFLIELLMTMGWYLLVAALILPLDLVADDPEPLDLAVAFTFAEDVTST